jgi:hypothetical protein
MYCVKGGGVSLRGQVVAGYRRDPDPGAPGDAANIIAQLIDLFVDLLKSLE